MDTLAIIITLAAAAVISIFFFLAFHQTKKQPQKNSQCYLETETSKPQTSFKRILADNSYNFFKHLNHPPNQQQQTIIQRFLSNHNSSKNLKNSHPYEKEITALLENSHKFEDDFGGVGLEMRGSHVWVDKVEELEEMVEVLSRESVFAVDTEQHSLRSFLGFTALMQVSTRSEDYLVDTIALHDVMAMLRPVFSNPKILKVFHGADNDVLWLQRDFHIYVVNLFDTAKACEVLLKPHKALAYLLDTYCGVAKNSMLQREDWRLRPLSEEMIQYARADAHYLLYVADRMVCELKNKNIDCLVEASRLSNMTCLKLYTKEIEAYPGDSAASLIVSRYLNGQGGVPLNSETKELVRRLCMWRDVMAHVHDESLRYVLSDQAIVALAFKPPTTTTEADDTISKADLNLDSQAAGFFHPSLSPVVSSHLQDICDLLAEKISNLGDVYETVIQKHLGPSGSCPHSVYNYALLTKSKFQLTKAVCAKQNGVKASKRFGREASRQLFVQKFSCKSPVYHNCKIYASDGRLLCYCDRRKLEWYLCRELAEFVTKDPPAIMLLFEPKGRPEDEDNDFYIQSKKNMCVGCGERNHYLRYRIIPSCYRVHFPEHLKSHRSHDIVLLCVDCHEIAHAGAEKHKRQIAVEFGIPLFVKKVADFRQTEFIAGTSGSEDNVEEVGVSPLQLRTAAMALLRHGSNMPIERREELTQTVMKFFGRRKISEEDLERALLVGMSPHEKRRLEKKRGFSFKNSSGGHLLKVNDNGADNMDTSAFAEALECDLRNGSQASREGAQSKPEDENLRMEVNTGGRDTHDCCDREVKSKTSATDGVNLEFNTTTISEKENVLNTDDIESRTLSDGTSNSSHYRPNGTSSPTYNKRLSLLGHGPHGKQVVDHLLKEFGEDGIRVFCQKWRQVFVESTNPRFLPSGWDVMHRGKRDFGEYSVYNPLKKDTITATD